MSSAAIDNDIIYKANAFDLLDTFLRAIGVARSDTNVLGSAKFVVAQLIKCSRPEENQEEELARFYEFIAVATTLEPVDEDLKLAARIEELAQEENLPIDTGESLLFAITINSEFELLVTGDKRAIKGASRLVDPLPELHNLSSKIAILEQLVRLSITEDTAIRKNICSHTDVDKALSIALSCSNPHAGLQQSLEGLNSYIEHASKIAKPIELAKI